MPDVITINLNSAQRAMIDAHGGGPTEAIRALMLRPSADEIVAEALDACEVTGAGWHETVHRMISAALVRHLSEPVRRRLRDLTE